MKIVGASADPRGTLESILLRLIACPSSIYNNVDHQIWLERKSFLNNKSIL